MANAFENMDIIAKEALVIAKNNMVIMEKVDRQHSDDFTNDTGDTIRIRKRVRYEAVDGADVTGQIRDIIEGSTTLTLDQFKSVPVEIGSKEMTLEVDDFNRIVTEPAMVELVQQVETSLAELYKEVYWFTGTPGTTPSTYKDINRMREVLTKAGVPAGDRCAFYEPGAISELGDGLKGVFPTEIARRAIENSTIGRYAMFDVIESVSLVNHTVGNYSGTPVVAGAGQEVTYDATRNSYTQTLNTSGWTVSVAGLLNEGDVFTLADVYSVNPKTRQSTGDLQTFVVRADAASDAGGLSTLTISPAIITEGANQTVQIGDGSSTVLPDATAIAVISGTAGAQYPQNLGLHRNAFTLAFANLVEPQGGARSARETMDGISVRVTYGYDSLRDKNVIRYDVLYGATAQNPQFAVRQTG